MLASNNTLQHIQVAVRCRPLNDREKKQNSLSVIECNEKKKEISVTDRASVTNAKTFTFDKVFGQNSKQIDVYNQVVKPLVHEVIEGYNCTVFAYGQTGTGKTFTMEGERSPNAQDLSWEEDPHVGIIPRSVSQLFSALNAISSCEYSVKISFLELYNEELSDLLSPSVDNEKLRLFEDPARKGSVVIPGLEEVIVQNKLEVYSILQRGAEKRQKAATLMNAQSSRSHSIFTVTVFIKEKSIDGEETIKVGKLNLVDLAGSENIERSGATGKRAAEAGKINKSLTTLGRVITALVEHRDHIPYRESNLTRLLQDSLGGRTKTSIIATITPASCNLEETLSTLDYAHKAKSIKNKPEVNQKLVKKALIKEYTEEIERLKRELCATREKNGIYLPMDLYQGMEYKIESQRDELRDNLQRINGLQEEIDKWQEMFKETKDELQERCTQLTETKEKLQETETKLASTEVELDENKYLLKEQVKTEVNLYDIADQLLKTASVSIDDCNNLHETLDRKHLIESQNVELNGVFTENMFNRHNLMFEDANEFHTSNSKRLSQVHSNLDLMLKRVFDNKEETLCELNIYTDKQNNFYQAISTDFIKNDLNKTLTNMKSGYLALNEDNLSKIITGLSEFNTNLLQKFDTSKEINEESIEKLNDLKLLLKENDVKYKANKIEYEQKFQTRIKCKTLDQLESIDHVYRNIEQIQMKVDSLNDFKTKFKESVDIQMSNLSKCLTENFEHIDQQLKSLNNELINEKTNLNKYKTDFKSNEVQIINETNDDLNSFWTELTQNLIENGLVKIDDLHQVLVNCGEKTNSTRGYCEQSISKTKSSINEDSANSNEFVSKNLCQLEEAIEKINTAINKNKIESTKYLNDYIENQINIESADLITRLEESLGVNKHTRESLDSFNERLNEFVNENKRLLDKYTNEDYKIDSSSGKTPKKRLFIYPTTLIRTQPHKSLLEQYREWKENKNSGKTSLGSNSAKTSLGNEKSKASSRSSSVDSLSSNSNGERIYATPHTINQELNEINKENVFKSGDIEQSSGNKLKPSSSKLQLINKRTLAVKNT